MTGVQSRAMDLLAVALDNRAHAAAAIALGADAAPSLVGAYVLGFKCAVHGEPEPELYSERERDCCRLGYERGAQERGAQRGLVLDNGMRLVARG